LSVATQWSQRALEYHRSPQVLDTYARLLYKQGQTDLATSIMTEAITMQQKEGYPTKDFDITLTKMKNKKPLDP
jgi:Flp pilus assembly protein TadD